MRLYACGYNEEKSQAGIWLFDLDEGLLGECGGVESPSFGAIAADAEGTRLMYFACEFEERAKLAAYRIGEDGLPQYLDEREFEGANGTCFVLVDQAGKCAYGANYNSGSICQCALSADEGFGGSWPLVQHEGHGPSREPEDPNRDRQLGPHVHTLSFVPGTAYMAAVDLGTDTISVYEPQDDGRVEPHNLAAEVHVPAGCGPRIVAYHPVLPIAAVVCELSCEVLIYSIREGGLRWELVERHGLIDGEAANWKKAGAREGIPPEEYPPLAAHAEFSKDGRFLYASTRGTNTIAIFEVDMFGRVRELAVIPCGGHSPRHFAISPDQQHLAVANQASDEISLFTRDVETGHLEFLRNLPCHQPSCVIWV